MIVAGVVAIVYSFHGWRHLGAMTQTRAIDRELKVARDASLSQPPGISQFEDLLARIKRIEQGDAPDEVKEALAGYIIALEMAINAVKAGENLTRYDQELEKAQKRLAGAVDKYWY